MPNPYNPGDWNRYSYVRYNPLRFVDPTGHTSACAYSNADPECPGNAPLLYQTFDERFGIRFKGKGWTAETRAVVRQAVFLTGMAFARGNVGITAAQAFTQEFSGGITFEWNTQDTRLRTEEQNANPACNGNFSGDCAARGGYTASSSYIIFATLSGQNENSDRKVKNVIHELGHAYRTGKGVPNMPGEFVTNRANILRPNVNDRPDWQQNTTPSQSETFADMVIAWVYGAWNTDSENVNQVREAQRWMNKQMP